MLSRHEVSIDQLVSGRLAELIGSTITVDSTVGSGSTFALVMAGA